MTQDNLKHQNYLLADKIINFDINAVPQHVIKHAKICLIDYLGALYSGKTATSSKLAEDFAVKFYQGALNIIGSKDKKANVIGVAMANAFAANAIDIDDGYRPSKGHPGALVISSAIAVADYNRNTGKELLESIILGYEIATRAAEIWHDYYPVYHSSGAWGALTTAAITAKLLKFNREQIYNAIGIAEWQAPMNPMMRCIDHPSMCKDGIGWGCPAGVTSALMAKEGFTGCPSLFGYKKYKKKIDSIGNTYNILKLYFKPYTCCRWAQPGIAGILKLLSENHIDKNEIKEVRVYTFKESASLNSTIPSNSEEAQYNIAFPIASIIQFGTFGPEQLEDHNFTDPMLNKNMNKIRIINEDRFDKVFPGTCSSEIEIELYSGEKYNSGIMQAKGDWDNPLTEEELILKFKSLFKYCRTEEDSERIINMIKNIEKFETLDEFYNFLK